MKTGNLTIKKETGYNKSTKQLQNNYNKTGEGKQEEIYQQLKNKREEKVICSAIY